MKGNRRRGHDWERRCVKLLEHIFPSITTARSESRSRDAQKVDLINEMEYKRGPLPYEFQCKATMTLNYAKELGKLPGEEIPVILHRKLEKKGDRFYEEGSYAFLRLSDFIELLEKIHNGDNKEPMEEF